jgi:DNA-binding MarR family transcriptional regulator
MTRTVDQLVATALVERATPPADRRQVLLSLTPRGSSVHRQALQAVYRVNRRALEGIPEGTQRTVVRAKQAMLTNLVADPDLARRLLNLSRDGD